MKRILHLITIESDALAQEIVRRQQQNRGLEVQVVDLREPQPDYADTVRRIFEADSVAVW